MLPLLLVLVIKQEPSWLNINLNGEVHAYVSTVKYSTTLGVEGGCFLITTSISFAMVC